MNQKHLAVLVLVLAILGCLGLAQKLNSTLAEAAQTREDTEFALNTERNKYNIKNIQVEMLKQDSQTMRDYLGAWLPKLKETDDEAKARNAFNRVLKQAGQGLISKRNVGKLEPVAGHNFVTNSYQSVVAMEGDYFSAMGFLAQLEKQLPASRVSAYTITKGTRGTDVKFNFTIDTPVLHKPETVAAYASPAAPKPF